MSHDEALIRDHSERLATVETMLEEIRRLAVKVDALNDNVIALRTERNLVVAIGMIIAGIVGGVIGKVF